MGFDQYHEPASELSQETRTFARMITSLIEEAEAINKSYPEFYKHLQLLNAAVSLNNKKILQ